MPKLIRKPKRGKPNPHYTAVSTRRHLVDAARATNRPYRKAIHVFDDQELLELALRNLHGELTLASCATAMELTATGVHRILYARLTKAVRLGEITITSNG